MLTGDALLAKVKELSHTEPTKPVSREQSIRRTQREMTKEYVLNKTYRWMVVSDDGLLKTPVDNWEEKIFRYGYSTEEEAVADYQYRIDNDLQYPYKMVLISEYSVDYVF